MKKTGPKTGRPTSQLRFVTFFVKKSFTNCRIRTYEQQSILFRLDGPISKEMGSFTDEFDKNVPFGPVLSLHQL